MADVKISALPASTTPLAGTEVLPIVQSATTRQVSVANLTAGRSVGGTNFIPSGSSVPTNGMFLPAANTLGYSTNSTERMRIDSSGSVGIGNTNPGSFDGSANRLVVGDGSTNQGISIYGSSTANLFFASGTTGTAAYKGFINYTFATDVMAFNVAGGNEAMRIDANRNLLVGITTARANAGDVQVSKGISFPATQSAQSDANTLDDYEEGTWTPTDASGAGLTFTGASGTYVKIGSLCYVTGALTFPVTVSAANVTIGGLPFNPNASTVYNNYGPPVRNDKSLSMQIFGVDNTTFILLPIGSYTTYVLNSAMTSGTMLFSFTYRTI